MPFGGKILTRAVAPILVSGPYLTCPRYLKLVRSDNRLEVGCEIRTEPPIPAKNITWTIKGEKPVKQKASDIEKTAYGEDILTTFDLTKHVERDDEEITVTVQVRPQPPT